ncbi:MAG TPA: Hsp33 family molecular chaperone HslO [Steroidobacteraceae bacterium]|jgi:molecular chaperone Hsp33|nr:Hsp33 family molecular chaperone HslO [Steroidobacteraceae bacterium]
MSGPDLVRRFVLDRHPIRGHSVRLSNAWVTLREHQDYPPAVRQLLGEAIGAVVLLAATLKFDGTLTLQLQGKGVVSLLVAQCTHDFKVRGMARHDPQVQMEGSGETGFRILAGEGTIVVTVEASDRASSYQGVVPITGNSLAESLEAYFHQSEQLPTRVLLAANSGVVSGMLVQRVPGVGGTQTQMDDTALDAAWQKAEDSMSSITRASLLEDDVEQRLINMFGIDEVRVFSGHEVKFECRCSRDRVANVLRSLGVEEVRSVIAEQGACTVTCEFCQKPYKFDAIDVEQLFAEAAPRGSDTIN